MICIGQIQQIFGAFLLEAFKKIQERERTMDKYMLVWPTMSFPPITISRDYLFEVPTIEFSKKYYHIRYKESLLWLLNIHMQRRKVHDLNDIVTKLYCVYLPDHFVLVGVNLITTCLYKLKFAGIFFAATLALKNSNFQVWSPGLIFYISIEKVATCPCIL
jgi:hypothetical protein